MKNCTTRRYEAAEYYDLEQQVIYQLEFLFPGIPVDSIPAYATKESFGDLDVLIESDKLPSDWQQKIINYFQPQEYVKNGNCFSFEYNDFQIDLILTPSEEYLTSFYYFAYNDLGNLIGRIAHMMGLKLGHDGLAYNWRISETQHFKTIVIERDWAKILPVFGLSYERYQDGFDTMEDIFKFVVSSPYFHKDIYLLHNRNHTSRVRDRKRKTYMEFLKWIESYEETSFQQTIARARMIEGYTKDCWLSHLFNVMPHFKDLYEEVLEEWKFEMEFRKRYNGDLVREWLNLDGVELGKFMKYIRESTGAFFKTDIVKMNPVLVERYVRYFYDKYLGNLPVLEFDVRELHAHRVKGEKK